MRLAIPMLFAISMPAQSAWTPLVAPAPTPRSDLALAFDPMRGELLVLGGWSGSADLDEKWTFDGVAWQLRTPATSPGPISSHRLAFDAVLGEVLAFGGWNGTSFLAGTWTWNGTTWTQRTPATSPPARYAHMLAADTARNRIVLFGGYCGSGCALDDTWEWDGVTWYLQQPSVRPTGRYSAGMVFDQRRGVTMLFGGRTLAARVNDAWTWNGSQWTALGTGGPSPRSTPAMSYDPLRQRTVVFGGFAGAYVNDTWEHNGLGWVQRTPSTPPAARGFAAMAFAPTLQCTVLFGGDNGAVLGTSHSYGALSPASATTLGAGCGSAMTLVPRDLPWLLDTCRITAGNLPAGTGLTFFAAGFSSATWAGTPLPLDLSVFGMNGCFLRVAAEVTAVVPANAGSAEYTFAVPAQTSLLGLHVFVQALAADAAVQPAGLAVTPALDLTVGAR